MSLDHRPDTAEAVRPMSWWQAAAWTFAATFAFLFVYSAVVSFREGAQNDQVSAVLAQAIGYGLVLFGILRVHAPEASVRDFVGLRHTSIAFYAIGPALGLAATIPANAIHHAIVTRFPFEESLRIVEIWGLAPTPTRLAMALMIAFVGPLVEEVFFRGALFGGLRAQTEIVRPTLYAALVTSLLFTIVHVRWQSFLPIMLVGLLIAGLRVASGSLLPPVLAHMAFNAAGVAELARGEELVPSVRLAVAGTAGTALLFAAAWWLGARSGTMLADRETSR
jgi:membrane protease YdiL (CAAX protease family)